MVVTDPITNPYLRDAQTNVHQRNALVDEYFRKPIVALRLYAHLLLDPCLLLHLGSLN